MSFQYKKVLVFGATSGIGWALAARFVENGVSVIVVGRRQGKLDEFRKQYGDNGKATVDTAAFDVTKLQEIPTFIKDMFSKHPDIDSVMLNAGLQRQMSWVEPEKVNLDNVELEIMTNYISQMHLTKAILPYLQKQAPAPTSLIYTSSGLALVPILNCPNYCATKAALHHMVLAMRQQLKDAQSNVKIIEIFPPAVQTELHDAKNQPELGDKGSLMGMPLADFTEEAYEGLCKEGDENEQIPVQAVKTFMGFYSWEQERQKTMMKMAAAQKKQAQ